MKTQNQFRLRHVFYLLLALVAVRAIYYSFSDGFNLGRIENTFPRSGLENRPITQDEKQTLQTICNQPFTYLGKGSQAYAFVSADDKYVLKLFKCYHLKPVDWLHKLPLVGYFDTYRHEQIARRDKKLRSALASYKIARDIIPHECGIIYLQIIPADDFSQKITFTDKIGRTHTLDIANYGFVLQKKAQLIFPVLDTMIREGNEIEAKAIVQSIVDLMVRRSKLGIQDQDPDLHKNAGIIDGKVYCIDIGGFHQNEHIKLPEHMQPDIRRFTRRLHTHLVNQHKPLADELARYLDQQVDLIRTN